jgi:predicted ABC-type ATPase
MSELNPNPTVIVLGGINGAGKTTVSRSLLAKTLRIMTYVNADVIAQGLSGFDPDAAAIRAGRIMLQQMEELVAQRANFGFESTLAGRSYANWLDSLRNSGYRVHLFYFWLNSPELAVARVATRVINGGHEVPEATIRQRYGRSVRNLFDLYMPVVTGWKVYDNSGVGRPRLIAKSRQNQPPEILEPAIWSSIRKSTANA